MGLAASQARLVFLTFEANSVSFNMQRLAMQRLRLTGESDKIASNYDKAMDTICYTTAWQANGNPDANYMALTYNKFMTPGSDFGKQFLLTDSCGRVVLSNNYCSKLGLIGNSGNTGSLNKTLSEFLQSIMQINELTANAYINGFSSTTETSQSTSLSVLELLNSEFIDAANSTKQSTSASWNLDTLVSSNLSWAEIYNRNLDVLISDHDDQDNSANFKKLLDDFYGDICSRFNINSDSSAALKYAYDQTYSKFTGNQQNVGSDNDSSTVWDKLRGARATGINGIITVNEHGTFFESDGNAGGAKVNVKNMIDTFFTYYQIKIDELNGQTNNYQVHNTVSGSTYANISNMMVYSQDPISSPEANSQQTANYYINLYNAIKKDGWVRVSGIENMSEADFENKLLEEAYKLKTLNSDGSWSDYSASSLQNQGEEVWVEDEEATEAAHKDAEREYDRKKAQIKGKEDKFDMEQQQLTTRYNSLTTEIDSVKKLIDNNIQRSFKLFQS